MQETKTVSREVSAIVWTTAMSADLSPGPSPKGKGRKAKYLQVATVPPSFRKGVRG